MNNKTPETPTLTGHGAARLPAVDIDTYNAELRDAGGFIGDRASNRAFRAILEDYRERVRREDGEDPLGETPSEEISKKKIDKVLLEGDPEAAGVVQGVIEEFAQEFATVIRRFLRAKGWRDTQHIVVGGGLRESRVGELAIGRTAVILKAEGRKIELRPIHHRPDEAGLLGTIHLAPSWIFQGHDCTLAVDIGGSNIRVGIVQTRLKEQPDLSKAKVWAFELWRHEDDKPKRDEAVQRLAEMLRELIKRAESKDLHVAPFVGIGCPGLISEDGSIKKGGQNLPGNWESKHFNLPQRLRELIPSIDGHETAVVMHNDAVVQGLSEVPFMRDVERWGVLTIGTGLGNARFTNRPPAPQQ
jgi:predicted NBD/HSP70 family sugar kinase